MKKFLAICLGVTVLCALAPPLLLLAQGGKYAVKGVVVDATGMPVIGATVVETGTTNGTTTDMNGQYQLFVRNSRSVVGISYVGYKNFQAVASSQLLARVTLEEDLMALDDVVVVGYGAVKKSDMTGSVVAVRADEINRGAVTSAQEMLRGKVPGVHIVAGDGAPGSGSEIRVRGGASLNASNNPLIVVDGVPITNDAAPGMPNDLATVNPNDIETFTVLKDASATAIYGSRASNGVILITTQKGHNGKLRISYNGSVSVKDNYKTMDMMNAARFKEYILSAYPDIADKSNALFGMADTDWQKQIYQRGIVTDHHLSVSGSVKDLLPYRVSAGYVYDKGTIKGSDNRRATLDVSLSPKFFKNHFSVNLNAKGINNKSDYIDEKLVGSAVNFDPTQSLYVYDADGNIDRTKNNGYYTWATTLADYNPLTYINDRWDRNRSHRALGNLQLNYRIHGLEALSFTLNLGLDITTASGDKGNNPGSCFAANDNDYEGKYKAGGRYSSYGNLHRNQLLEFYGAWNKERGIHKLDLTAGYSWEMNYFSTSTDDFGRIAAGTEGAWSSDWLKHSFSAYRSALVSFYGRANYSFDSRYLFTATARADGSSRFGVNNRWGIFPSAAFAWNVAQEKFLKNSHAVSALKLRLGWGETGQQEIANYAAVGYSNISTSINNQYPMGSGFYYPLRPVAYNPDLKWEATTTYNVGADFGFLDGRINGSVEAYLRQTSDMLSEVATPLGSNFSNILWSNIGSMRNKGVEVSLNFTPVQTQEWMLQIGLSGTFQHTEVTKLTADNDPGYGVDLGNGGGGTGNKIQRHQVGYAPYTFYLWQQAYDNKGHPIENGLVDRDGNGEITAADRYMTNKSPSPDFYYGINLKLSYRNWDFGCNGHGTVGNYMFNDVMRAQSTSYYRDIIGKNYLINASPNAYKYGFRSATSTPQLCSDLFLENASFFRMDDINLGYTFRNVSKRGMQIRVVAGVQNVFTITDYSGLDPETTVGGGIDGNIYPRPRIYSLRLGIDF